MDYNERDENEVHFDEPPMEDFLPNEEDDWLRDRQKKRRSFFKKLISIGIAFALLVSVIQIWPQLFNMSSIKFLQKSAELSELEEIQAYKEAVVTIQDQHSKGTGFNISEEGLIITNHHVIDNMNPITITFPNGEIFNGNIIHSNPDLDLAFLTIQGNNLPYLTLSKNAEWQIDDPIYVIGNPLLHHQIVNEGNIIEGSNLNGVLRISAPIFKGNSGSPVINGHGEVVGVVYALSIKDQTGLAIPIEQVHQNMPN
ncbi:S1-C subfamily serine protease [Cytobacillus eiseniae]|uniref:S1-C subfamily serine protease n=1 Tax=Cytobacillus eiseniae TaxID=762947 RepID=A0ABS4RBB0_9BACI|nr:serine protease [Cytobacillus eiseniae]MBP2239624.1 S1-C subfamily serine protease [Cytobacillus eiseniae]